jgi:hypothetical protein
MPSESTLVDKIRRAVEKLGCSFEKHHGSIYGKTGDQDILILVPVSYQHYPVPLFVEAKRPGKVPTPLQEKRMQDRRKVGAVAIPAWSADDVSEAIAEIRSTM